MDFFEAYGVAASKLNTPVLISGRSLFNENIESIVADVVRKLEINSQSSMLEIGCGVGLLLTPLSRQVARAVGVDHEQCIERYKEFGVPNNVELIPGRWPLVELTETFDSIVVYSVMHYLKDPEEAFQFIDKALLSLKNNGKLLLADIPNGDMFQRFKSSEIEEKVTKEYRTLKALHENDETQAQSSIFSSAMESVTYLDDGFVLSLLKDLRRRGYDAYILPQPRELPFSYSREDILIWKR
ncbi:MAG TPA: class I SAM-dependent methyltransferase [Methylobacter sp.]|jgi:cyclopropane fatty-acyl-phospholipid synthase-like methyltransferase